MNISYNKALQISKELQQKIKGLRITGSVKRMHPSIYNIVFLTMRSLDDIAHDFMKLPAINITIHGSKLLRLNVSNTYFLDFWHVPSKNILPFYIIEFDNMDDEQYNHIAKCIESLFNQ